MGHLNLLFSMAQIKFISHMPLLRYVPLPLKPPALSGVTLPMVKSRTSFLHTTTHSSSYFFPFVYAFLLIPNSSYPPLSPKLLYSLPVSHPSVLSSSKLHFPLGSKLSLKQTKQIIIKKNQLDSSFPTSPQWFLVTLRIKSKCFTGSGSPCCPLSLL